MDYSGNHGNWIWIDDFEYEDENDLQFILRDFICKYLTDKHPTHFC